MYKDTQIYSGIESYIADSHPHRQIIKYELYLTNILSRMITDLSRKDKTTKLLKITEEDILLLAE